MSMYCRQSASYLPSSQLLRLPSTTLQLCSSSREARRCSDAARKGGPGSTTLRVCSEDSAVNAAHECIKVWEGAFRCRRISISAKEVRKRIFQLLACNLLRVWKTFLRSQQKPDYLATSFRPALPDRGRFQADFLYVDHTLSICTSSDIRYRHIGEHLYWGSQEKRTRHGSYKIAEPEKALLDWIHLQRQEGLPVVLDELNPERYG